MKRQANKLSIHKTRSEMKKAHILFISGTYGDDRNAIRT